MYKYQFSVWSVCAIALQLTVKTLLTKPIDSPVNSSSSTLDQNCYYSLSLQTVFFFYFFGTVADYRDERKSLKRRSNCLPAFEWFKAINLSEIIWKLDLILLK